MSYRYESTLFTLIGWWNLKLWPVLWIRMAAWVPRFLDPSWPIAIWRIYLVNLQCRNHLQRSRKRQSPGFSMAISLGGDWKGGTKGIWLFGDSYVHIISFKILHSSWISHSNLALGPPSWKKHGWETRPAAARSAWGFAVPVVLPTRRRRWWTASLAPWVSVLQRRGVKVR